MCKCDCKDLAYCHHRPTKSKLKITVDQFLLLLVQVFYLRLFISYKNSHFLILILVIVIWSNVRYSYYSSQRTCFFSLTVCLVIVVINNRNIICEYPRAAVSQIFAREFWTLCFRDTSPIGQFAYCLVYR